MALHGPRNVPANLGYFLPCAASLESVARYCCAFVGSPSVRHLHSSCSLGSEKLVVVENVRALRSLTVGALQFPLCDGPAPKLEVGRTPPSRKPPSLPPGSPSGVPPDVPLSQGMFVRHIYWYGPAVGPFREQLARVVQNYTFPSLFMPYDLARRPGATYRNARVQSRIRVPRHRHPNVTRWCLTVKKANQERNLGCGGPAPNVLHYTAPCPDS